MSHSPPSTQHPAKQLWRAGYGAALIPIIPPTALLSPSTSVDLSQRGKIPGKRLDDGTWVGFTGWTKHQTALDDVERWSGWGGGIGLRTRDYPFIDVDVLSDDVAPAIANAIEQQYGRKLLRRYGRAPRLAIPFRTDAPFGKVVFVLRDAANGEAGKVEVLADGNQIVVEGIHPKTGAPYEWRDGDTIGGAEILATHSPDSLPSLDASHLPTLRATIAQAVASFGLTVQDPGATNGAQDAGNIDQTSLRATSIAALREVVVAIPNNEDFADRSKYIGMLYAIRAAAGADNYDDGLEVAQEWAARWDGENNPDKVRGDYASCAPAYNGWHYLLLLAQRYGYNSAKWSFDAATPHDDHLTDMGNASRFARHFANRLIFVGDQWLKWDGRRWAKCDEVELQEMAKRVVRSMFDAAITATDSEDRKKRTAWAFRSESMPSIRAMVSLARGALAVSVDTLDANPWLINVANGTLDLRTGELRAHCPVDYITKLAPVTYDANATCPRWLGFLDRIMGGDDTLISVLQRMTGYSLTGLTTEQVLFLLHGIGANGKSTYLELIREMFGDYAVQTKHTTLLEQRNGDGARPEIIKLRGARAITASEVPVGRQFDAATVKALTGGDTLSERDLYKSPVEFRIEGKVWAAVNHCPRIDGDDSAMWRRIRLIPFKVTIPEDERDPDLLATLRGEMAGIFRWAVEGCLAWQEGGLKMPPAVTNATAGYRAEMSTVAAFIQAKCRLVRGVRTTKKDLYGAFGVWCKETGDTTLDQGERAFNNEVERHDPGRIVSKKSSVMCWEGIEVLPTIEELI